MTKKEMYEQLLTNYATVMTEDELAFLAHQKDLVSKRSKSDKPTKTQLENLKTMDALLEAMGDGEFTATEAGALLGLSCQKASSLLKKMTADGKVVKTVVKGESHFKVADNA